MTLSKLQLSILVDRLQEILPVHKKDDEEFVCDVLFEHMLCLATNIDLVSANKIYNQIYQEANYQMGHPLLETIISKYVADI